MKLNKMLALALSGVMAVSMLAGCSGAPSNGEEGDKEQPTTSNAVAVMNDAQDDVTFSSNPANDSALKAAVEKANYNDIKDAGYEPTAVETKGNIYNALKNKVEGLKTTVLSNASLFGDDFSAESKVTYANLYIVEANGLSEEQALKNVLKNMETDKYIDSHEVKTNVLYTADYTGSVSVEKITETDSINDKTESAYVILVSVTRTVTKTSDTGSVTK